MRIDLTGRAAVVTGSPAGIGFAIAAGLAEARARVVINGRQRDGVERALERLRPIRTSWSTMSARTTSRPATRTGSATGTST